MIKNGQTPVRFGPFCVDLHTHELRKDAIKLRLVGQPFEILAMLLGRPGELVTREELRERLWPGDTFVDFDHGLNAAVNKLREALCDSADSPRYVETLPRRGYRFIGNIEGSRPAMTASREVGGVLEIAKLSPDMPVEFAGQSGETFPARSDARQSKIHSWIHSWRESLPVALVLCVSLAGGALLLRTGVSRGKVAEAVLQPPKISSFTSPTDDAGEPAFSADGNYIAFYRDGGKPGDSGIFVQQIGSDQSRQLTRNEKDCCAVWSPDGRSIAFSRSENRELTIYVVPAGGGSERRLEVPGAAAKVGALDWSPDGKMIAFSGGASLSVLSLDNSAVRRLTAPPPLTQDWGPSFSRDGKQILFVRSSEMGFPEEIMTIAAAGGEAILITTESARLHGSPRWSADGRSVIFASDRGGKSALWRVSAETRAPAVQFNENGSRPAVSRMGGRLAYERETRSLTIWEMDLPTERKAEPQILMPLTSQTDQGPGPQFSPDGKKLAYMSDRSGMMEIWVSDRDGSNALQLSAVGDAGTPRWSPDSESIVFDANRRRGAMILVLSLRGGAPRILTQDEFENRCPSWSRDGKWIYFASSRAGSWQVWKIPSAGGTPVQVTKLGGHAAFESADGKLIYYAKTPHANPEIWQAPTNGGHESLVSARVRPPTWASWAVVDDGILFAEPSGTGAPVLNLFDLKNHRVKTVGMLHIVPFWLAATHDGKTVAFDQPGWRQAQIMLIENFR
jgi:Tol biopolymer transport system component/DNA-binding winged helix-turn-helix (wHTH) protein